MRCAESCCSDYVDISTLEWRPEALINRSLDFQPVKQTLEGTAPAHFDEVLEIYVYASRLGHTSFTLITEFRVDGGQRIIVTAETVYGLVQPHTLTKLPLPEELRRVWEHGAQPKVTDHAGCCK